MPDIHDQLAWEQRMIDHGVERYRGQQDKAITGDRAHETSAGAALLRAYVLQISDHIRLYLDGKHPEGRRRNKYAKLLATVDTDKTAMFALKAVISSLYTPQTTQTVLINIGKVIEDELRFARFHAEHKEYYDEIVRSWETKRTQSYRHKKNTLSVKSREKGMDWEDWNKETRFGVGSLVISLLMEVCDLVEIQKVSRGKGRFDALLVPTQECIEWVMKHNASAEIGNPHKMPCIIPPADWESVTEGGYYSAQMRMRSPLVKNAARGTRRTRFENADMTSVMTAINAMQRTGWSVNTRVFEVMKEVWQKNLGIGMPRSQPYEIPPCPLTEGVKVSDLAEDSEQRQAFNNWKAAASELHSMERERVSQNLAVSRTIRMANEMSQYEEFFYVYQCDFRGRVYSTASGLSPQSTDQGKALLQFSEGKPLGKRGLYWLMVHGANKYGEDKCHYDDRVQWIKDREADILEAADDPVGRRDVWQDADKPYQFLAFVFEYAEAVREVEPANYVSRLPVALDGSCNGLQHFSAMLRDRVGGAAVNLTSKDKPADIYQEVADVCTRKLQGLRSLNTKTDGAAVNWLALFESLGEERLPRKLAKKPVMTLPYGSTQQACTETVFRWSQEASPGFFEKGTDFRHALYLSPKLWASISEVVIAARQAMDWLQECAGGLAKEGLPISYVTPLGFPVHQSIHKYTSKQIETQIGGRLQLRLAYDTDRLDSRKQRQGSSPNFVHSIDATHMMMCINEGAEQGITSCAMIHDDFGTHACDTPVWHKIIREQFVQLHSVELLRSFKEQHEEAFDIELPDLPPVGDLDLNEVRKSLFFFG